MREIEQGDAQRLGGESHDRTLLFRPAWLRYASAQIPAQIESPHVVRDRKDCPSPQAVEDIDFIPPGQLVDGDLELRLVGTTPADHVRGFAPVYRFAMMKGGSDVEVGNINLRIGHTQNIELFRGHIGFGVLEPFRGSWLALRSCRLLAGLARHHALLPVWLTCDEGNVASQRTIEALGAQFVEVRHMPTDFPYIAYYGPEARVNRRYRWVPRPVLTSRCLIELKRSPASQSQGVRQTEGQ